ncbi:hypothetical protein D3C71_2187220 [compost metagenome]
MERIKQSGGTVDFLIHVQPKNIKLAQSRYFAENPRGERDRDDIAARSEFFGSEPLKGSFRRGSMDMSHFDRYW